MMNCLLMIIFGYKLNRICSNKKLAQGTRTWKIDLLLRNSKGQAWKQLLLESDSSFEEEGSAVDGVSRARNSPLSDRTSSTSSYENLSSSLEQIQGYDRLTTQAELMRKTPYSSENPLHESLLLTLWSLLKPEVPLTGRISKQWTEIGFQGSDPMTDFRGMGILALHNLVYFSTYYNSLAHQLMRNSCHKQIGYSLAIVSINLTGLTYNLLTSGHLKIHFYNTVPGQPQIDDLHRVFAYLFFEFDKFWFSERPVDVMQFNSVKDKFKKMIIRRLKNNNCSLSLNCLTPSDSTSRGLNL